MTATVVARQCRISNPEDDRAEVKVEVSDTDTPKVSIHQHTDTVLLTLDEWKKVSEVVELMIKKEWPS
jgi:hypothetical protein